MKIRGRYSTVKLFSTVFVLQVLAFFFVYFRENWLLEVSQSFVWLGLIILCALVFLEGKKSWQGTTPIPAQQSALKKSFKTLGLFLFLLLFIWQINYLSLYEVQPLMYGKEDLPIRYDVTSGDLLAYTLRLGLQTWVLALALALVINKVPRNGEFGFIRGKYLKTGGVAWYVSNMSGGAVTIVVLFCLGLLTLDLGKFLTKIAGADVMLIPQLELFLFLFSMYLFNISMRFSKKIKEWGSTSEFSFMSIILIQLIFFLFVYCISRAMLHFLPRESLISLMEPFYFDFIDEEAFGQYWQLFTLSLALFLVPLLAHYLYHACQGEKVGRSLVRLLFVPVLSCWALTQIFPGAQNIFYDLSPVLNMKMVPLNDFTIRYEISWISYLSAILLMIVILSLQRSQNLVQSLVDVMPEHLGYRVRRLKAFYSRAFSLMLALLVMYLFAGVMFSVYLTSLFLMGTLLGFVLCFVAGFKRMEA